MTIIFAMEDRIEQHLQFELHCLKEKVCESCDKTEWMDKPLPLEVHGDKYNND